MTNADEPAPPLSGPVVIDASCVVEYLVELTHTGPATRLFHLAADGRLDLWAPDLVYPECVSALRRLAGLGAIPDAPTAVAAERLPRLPIMATGSAALMPAVWRMRAFLTPYDACYVALADELGAIFVTGERNLVVELGKRGRRARFLGDL